MLFKPSFARPIAVVTRQGYAAYASSSEPDLKTTFAECLPAKRELLKKVKAKSDKVIGEVRVENALGGMRQV